MPKTVKERAQEYFGRYKKVKKLYATSDGFLFQVEQHAKVHAKSLEEKAVSQINNSSFEKQEVISDAASFLKQNANKIIKQIAEETSKEVLETYLEEEEQSETPRQKVVNALSKRIDELTPEQ